MTIQFNDPELERMKEERDHLWNKLTLAKNSGLRDANKIERLQRSLESADKAIADRFYGAKITPG